jgi:hypothetical protein
MSVKIQKVNNLSCDPRKHRRVWLTEKDGVKGQLIVCPECKEFVQVELVY